MAKKIGKKPKASKSTVATAKRPSPVRAAAKAPTKASKAPVKPIVKPVVKPVVKPAVKSVSKPYARVTAGPVVAAPKPVAKTVAGKAATPAKPAAVVAKPPAAAVDTKPVAAVSVKKPAKPAKVVIPMAEKSAVVTAYARVPGLSKPAATAVAVKKPARPIESKPVRLPPPPVTSNSKTAKNRAGLSTREIEHFRDLLLEKRRELLGDVSSMETSALRSGNSNLSTLPMHMADAGTDNYEQEFTLGLVEKDRQLMREINIALAKIQDGSYGICEGTGKAIATPRLEAQPWARYSIEHARALEKPQFRRAF